MASKTAREIEHEWILRICALGLRTRRALRRVMLDLAAESRAHSAHAWRQQKAPMALYHRAVATHCERLERALRRQSGERAEKRERCVPESYSTRAAAAARKRRWRELLSDIEEVEREKTRELLRSLKLEVGRESNRTRSRTRVHAAVRLRVLSVHTGHVMRAVQTEPVQVGKLRRSEQAETDDGVDDCRREPG